DLKAKRTGVIRIGCLPSVASTFLPRRIANFRKTYPGISFRLNDALGDKVIGMVRSGEVEFGITDVHSGANDLESIPLLEEQMCVLFLAGHPIESAHHIDIEELARYDLILMGHGSNARRIVDTAFAASGRMAIAACEASYMSTAVGMVQAGLGIALLPLGGVHHEIDSRFQTRVIDAPGFVRQIAIIKLKQKSLSPAAKEFVQGLHVGV
ncbi:MAG TPA: LysR substrate-binding domain-containing protein, partial [Methyloradius sp.]